MKNHSVSCLDHLRGALLVTRRSGICCYPWRGNVASSVSNFWTPVPLRWREVLLCIQVFCDKHNNDWLMLLNDRVFGLAFIAENDVWKTFRVLSVREDE